MKRVVLCIIMLTLVLASCNRTGLKKGDWNKKNYKALNTLLTTYGSSSENYDPEAKPYAVFDFDNTTIIGDISLVTLVYQIENLRYKIDPENLYLTFTNCIPDIDCALEGFEGISARMLATDLQNDYNWLYSNYIKDHKLSLKEVYKSDEYQDFRAKLWALSLGSDSTFGYEVGCLWIFRLFSGMTVEELEDLTRVAAESEMSRKKVKTEEWTSPDMGEAGVVTVEVPRGLKIRPEMANLYKSLETNGFDVYICSASSESIVESVACSDVLGLGLDPANVYGLRINSGDRISPNAGYLPGYPNTYHEGKTRLIREYIMKDHGGKAPALVAGDSNGDYNMLVDFDDMKLGLIIDQPSSGQIDSLKKQHDDRYHVQKWK